MEGTKDAFWTLVGLIKQAPRLWGLSESSMLDEAKSNFRHEFTLFRAILAEKFPDVRDKLYQTGLAIETLVYDSVTSLYSDNFESNTLLRIWDQLFFHFALADKKRGGWMILTPALMIIRLKREEILQCQTAQEIIDTYNDGFAEEMNQGKVNFVIKECFKGPECVLEWVFVTKEEGGGQRTEAR